MPIYNNDIDNINIGINNGSEETSLSSLHEAINNSGLDNNKGSGDSKTMSGVKIMGLISFILSYVIICVIIIAIFMNAHIFKKEVDVSQMLSVLSISFGILATVWGAKAVHNFSPKR